VCSPLIAANATLALNSAGAACVRSWFPLGSSYLLWQEVSRSGGNLYLMRLSDFWGVFYFAYRVFVGEVSRFRSGKQVAKYFGLVPRGAVERRATSSRPHHQGRRWVDAHATRGSRLAGHAQARPLARRLPTDGSRTETLIGQPASSPPGESELDTLSRASTTNGCMV